MNIDRIDLNLLKVFVAVYREKSLSRASEKLFVTTPAVSQNIKKLKESLGEELFVLSGRKFVPTPYSDALYQRVFPLLDGLASALEEGRQFEPSNIKESFRVDLNPHILPWLTPALLKGLIEQSSKSTLVTHSISPSTLRALCDDEIDIAIHFETDKLPSEIVALPLTRLPFVLAMREEHWLDKTEISLDELSELLIAHIDLAYWDPTKRSRLEDKMKNLGKPIQVAMRTTSVMGLLDTVATTDLVAPCFAPVAKSYHGNLKQVHIPDVEDIGAWSCSSLSIARIWSPLSTSGLFL
ncbi:transcriptional regulator [Vibrio ishigakensis]|uniref:Transcriptional regulator n=1 Tax=Vibrio ishigakensis TaxID=1481914 RepID=A0A0B8P8S4_9VIBR|nr:transcriptional regulator [Vibrio ishigakensis]